MAGNTPDSQPHQWVEIVALLKLEETLGPDWIEKVGTAVSLLDDNSRFIEDRLTIGAGSAKTLITSPGVQTWDGAALPANVARGRIYYNSATDEYGAYDGTSIVPLGEEQGLLGFFMGDD